MKDVGGNKLGSEDQDFGRGKDIINQDPISPQTREKSSTLSLFTGEQWPPALEQNFTCMPTLILLPSGAFGRP